MSRARSNARRLKQSVQRVEQTPYEFGATKRAPRLGGASQILWCQLPSSLAAATGTFPSITPSSVTGVTIYRPVNGALVALPGTWKVYNFSGTALVTGKKTEVSACGDGTFQVVVQDC